MLDLPDYRVYTLGEDRSHIKGRTDRWRQAGGVRATLTLHCQAPDRLGPRL
jgi:hypothetical protein